MNIILEILVWVLIVSCVAFLLEAILGARWIKNLSIYIKWRRILGITTIISFVVLLFFFVLNVMLQ